MRVYRSRFGFLRKATNTHLYNDLCAKLFTVTPHANSPSPELALEFAPPIHSAFSSIYLRARRWQTLAELAAQGVNGKRSGRNGCSLPARVERALQCQRRCF